MKVIHLHEIVQVPVSHEDPQNPSVVKQVLFQKYDLPEGVIQMINWATLLPGKSFQEHIHESMDEIFIILSGNARMKVDNKKNELTRGDAVLISKKSRHMMENTGKTAVEYLVIGISDNGKGKPSRLIDFFYCNTMVNVLW